MRHSVTLQDGDLALRPLVEEDFAQLLALARATPEQWALMGSSPAETDYAKVLHKPLELPFVMEWQGEVVGATRLCGLDRKNRAAEIGYSWLKPDLHGQGVNRRAKFLLLRYAFEELWDGLGCIRVQFRTDARNRRSQRAIENLGATREGVFRRVKINDDGYIRDTVYYAITDLDWAELNGRT